MFLRAQYNYDTMAASDEAGLKCEDKSLAQQHQASEADINTIVKRFGLTGQLPSNVRVPQYGDFTSVTDYQTALNAVIAANDAFMLMPAYVRARFGNDPAQFVDFCSKPENSEEMIKLGLAVKKEGLPEVQTAPQAVPQGSATPGAPADAGAK